MRSVVNAENEFWMDPMDGLPSLGLRDGDRIRSERWFIVHGLRRSGRHAVVDWIASAFKNPFIMNDCDLTQDTTRRRKERFAPFLGVLCGPQPFDREKRYDAVIVSAEDLDLRYSDSWNVRERIQELSGEDDPRVTTAVVLRHPANLVASHLAARFHGIPNRDVWLSHAEARTHLRNPVLMPFEPWFESKGRRRSLADALMLPFPYPQLPSKMSRASSFEGVVQDPSKLGVQDRYKTLSVEDVYRARYLLRDEETWRRCRGFFPSLNDEIREFITEIDT